ncbi:methyltransferase [Cyclobacterium sp.]|uniref:tRNA1(Val) (adenine(37)-N6)-methyltransferase n=1 Tax=Cyclobacterium sp. TaxID=1966343 RepID=UPI0019B8B3E0|nr:methyltransferase [Cyclobacterium sp.]MBD3628242.1 methyltransferase [Cyclobacterium sp.]
MANSYFQFKQFRIEQDRCAMKVSTDAVVLGALVSCSEPAAVLDIGTGTGVLALMMAQKYPSSQIEAIELEQEAFLQASQNVMQSPFFPRVNVIHDDFKIFSAKQGKRYDLIISNPPYFAGQLQSGQKAIDLARHENGLNFAEIWKGVDKLLAENGSFWLILPYREMSIFTEMGLGYGLYQKNVTSLIDKQGGNGHRKIAAFTRINTASPQQYTLTIRDHSGAFMPEYRQALREFMLHF